MMQIPGKRVRTVPVFILPEIKKTLDILVKARVKHSIFPDNVHFFSMTSSNGVLESCKVMRRYTRLAKVRTAGIDYFKKLKEVHGMHAQSVTGHAS